MRKRPLCILFSKNLLWIRLPFKLAVLTDVERHMINVPASINQYNIMYCTYPFMAIVKAITTSEPTLVATTYPLPLHYLTHNMATLYPNVGDVGTRLVFCVLPTQRRVMLVLQTYINVHVHLK